MDNYPDGVSATDPYFEQRVYPPECPECYGVIDEEWKFCPWCGKPIDWERVWES